MLDMHGAGYFMAHPLVCAQVDRLVGDAMLVRKRAVGGGCIGDQQCLPVKPGQQVALELRRLQGAAANERVEDAGRPAFAGAAAGSGQAAGRTIS